MKVTVDTNVLVRAVMQDDARQARAATRLLRDARLVAIPLPCLCEFAWVLQRSYGLAREDIAAAIETLVESGNVSVNRQATQAGLALLRAGGDFADGLMAFEGAWLGGDEFASFDRQAVRLLERQGKRARLLT